MRTAKRRQRAWLRALGQPRGAPLARRKRRACGLTKPRSRPRRHPGERDDALAQAGRDQSESARPQDPTRIDRFEPLGRLARAGRERARPGARTGRDCANVFRGARSLPRREASMNNDHDHDHANDNGGHEKPGGKQVASAPAGGALASIASLAAALANVPIGIGRTGLPMMLFKSREDGGTWGFGQRRTIPEEGSRWAVNPLTIQWGCISFGDGNKVVGERLGPITQPKPLIADMPDL